MRAYPWLALHPSRRARAAATRHTCQLCRSGEDEATVKDGPALITFHERNICAEAVGVVGAAAALRYKRSSLWPHRGCTRGACPKLLSGRGTGDGHHPCYCPQGQLLITVRQLAGFDCVARSQWRL